MTVDALIASGVVLIVVLSGVVAGCRRALRRERQWVAMYSQLYVAAQAARADQIAAEAKAAAERALMKALTTNRSVH